MNDTRSGLPYGKDYGTLICKYCGSTAPKKVRNQKICGSQECKSKQWADAHQKRKDKRK